MSKSLSKAAAPQAASTPASQICQHPLLALRDEMDDLLSRFFGGSDEGWFSGRMSPVVDLSETDNAIEVAVDVPGIDPDEVDIRLTGNTHFTASKGAKEVSGGP
jgi:HSP20 family protein